MTQREEIILMLCGMIKIPEIPQPIYREPRLAGADWHRDALIDHPGFEQFVALLSRDDVTHTAETVRAAWSWFQAGWHADAAHVSCDDVALARIAREDSDRSDVCTSCQLLGCTRGSLCGL